MNVNSISLNCAEGKLSSYASDEKNALKIAARMLSIQITFFLGITVACRDLLNIMSLGYQNAYIRVRLGQKLKRFSYVLKNVP